MTQTTTITDAQIEQLRTEAGQAGDLEQVAICDRALNGDESARAECARVIDEAQAMADPVDDAISRSRQQNEIVTLPWSAEAETELWTVCRDWTKNGDVIEFWGDEDGQWRVHLQRS